MNCAEPKPLLKSLQLVLTYLLLLQNKNAVLFHPKEHGKKQKPEWMLHQTLWLNESQNLHPFRLLFDHISVIENMFPSQVIGSNLEVDTASKNKSLFF